MTTTPTPSANILSNTIGEYLTHLAGQEGLYVGLGLGAVLGGLLATKDIKVTLGKAFELIKLVEGLASELQDNVIIDME